MKINLYALFFLFIGTSSFAQLSAGCKAGINFNSFVGNKAYDVVPGYNAGVFIKYPVLSFLTARAELLYSQQGANLYDYVVIKPELNHHKAKLLFHSIQLPVIAELGLPALKEESLQPKLLLGGYYSYSVAVQEKYVNVAQLQGYPAVEYKGASFVSEDYYRNQYGLLVGVAAEMTLFSMPVALEFRYQQALNAVNRPESRSKYNVKNTVDVWGDDLKIGTLSFNVAVTLAHF